MYRLAVAAFWAVLVRGQTQQTSQDLLKEAVTFHQNGKLDEAIRDYSVFLDKYPNAAQVRSNLAAALVGTGKYQLAIDQYKLALSAKPDPDVQLNLAIAYYKAAQYANAARELTAVHEADAANTKAAMLLADCKLRLGDNKKVIELLTSMHEAAPDDLGIDYLLGTALAREGDSDRGQAVIAPILAKGDSAEARLLMGTTRFAGRDFTKAVADLAKAVEMNPNLPEAYSYYGLALFSIGEMDGARKAFLEALRQNANDFQANLHVGTLLRLDQNYDEALAYLNKALGVRPGDPATRYQIGLVMLAQNKVAEARDEFEAIVKQSPSFTEAHVSLATVYYREKRKEDGDRQRAIVQKLNDDKQAQQPGAKLSDAEKVK